MLFSWCKWGTSNKEITIYSLYTILNITHNSRSGADGVVFPVRSVSGVAKWLRSLRPCRLRNVRQDKVSGDPCIECSCDTVGCRGDLAKVASLRSLPELGLGRVEGAPVAWGGPRARRESTWVYCSCPRLGSSDARSRPLSGRSLDLNCAHQPLQFALMVITSRV
jgi:hypothetical protein